MIARLANGVTDVIGLADESARKERLAALVARYGPATGVTERTLTAAVECSSGVLMRDADVLGRGVARNDFLHKARAWRSATEPTARAAVQDLRPASSVAGDPAAAGQSDAATLPAGGTAQALAETQ